MVLGFRPLPEDLELFAECGQFFAAFVFDFVPDGLEFGLVLGGLGRERGVLAGDE